MEYEVTMSNEDWENVYTYYNTYDGDGNELKKTVLKACREDPSNADWKKCTFILGKLSTAQCAEHGLEDQDCRMQTAGWLNGANGYGQRGATGTWAWPPTD